MFVLYGLSLVRIVMMVDKYVRFLLIIRSVGNVRNLVGLMRRIVSLMKSIVSLMRSIVSLMKSIVSLNMEIMVILVKGMESLMEVIVSGIVCEVIILLRCLGNEVIIVYVY